VSTTATTTVIETEPPRLVFFYNERSGGSRPRRYGFLAQVLQRRRNPRTFRVLRIEAGQRPDLADRFQIHVVPGTVKEGFIGRHLTFVPLVGVTLGPDHLQVTVSAAAVKAAPNIEMHGDELSQADESKLYHHYELNYTAPTTESGRRLARR
jgi:hypothetical protein